MTDFIIILAVVIIVAAASFYALRQKRKGKKCIGCPYAGECKKTDRC